MTTTITVVELTRLVGSALDAARKVENAVSSGGPGDAAEEARAVDALRVLAQQHVTTALLASTEAGKRLKKLGKHPSPKVAQAATAAVDAWKDCIRREQQKQQTQTQAQQQAAPQEPPKPGGAASKVRMEQAAPAGGAQATTPDSQPLQQQPSGDGQGLARAYSNKMVLEPAKAGDETRDKIRKLLAEALATAIGPDVFGDPCAVAVEAETALFRASGGVNPKYKAKFRSLSFNLKDPKNPDLRSRVLTGQIPGDVLVTLSAEEMASSEMRAKNEQIREHMKNEAVRGQTTQASTDMFQCGRCKQRKCTYYQMQTRSADEPMTTFVSCTNCNNRWKFC